MIRVQVRDTAGNAFVRHDEESFDAALYLAKQWVRDGFTVEIVPVIGNEPEPAPWEEDDPSPVERG